MRVVVTGGSGVLGRSLVPLLVEGGYEVSAPGRRGLDLFDPPAVARAVAGADAVYHLATRIPPPELMDDPASWRENDRLRETASRLLVGAALSSTVSVYVQPTVTFVYPSHGPVDETTPAEAPAYLESALAAEREAARFAEAGGRGVALRLGLLDGPGTGLAAPETRFGATLHVDDAGRALIAALEVPSGVYNVCRDGERVSNARFADASGWRPQR